MNSNNNKPKLELQVNIPQKIKLLQDSPATGESQYGKWWLYNVLANEQEQSFFAPESVVNFISENNLKRNSELEITKKLVKNGKKNITHFNIEIISNGYSKSENTSSNPIDSKAQVDNTYGNMLEAMREAIKIKEELVAEVDINKVGISLFIQKCRGY